MIADFLPSSMPEGRTPVYFICRNYFPTITGATERFRRYLPGLAERGVDFFIITSWTDQALPQVEQVGENLVGRLPVEDGKFVNTETLLRPMMAQLLGAARGTIQIYEISPKMRPMLKQLRASGHRIVLIRTIMPSLNPPRFSLRGIKSFISCQLEASIVDRITAGTTVMRDAHSQGSGRVNPEN